MPAQMQARIHGDHDLGVLARRHGRHLDQHHGLRGGVERTPMDEGIDPVGPWPAAAEPAMPWAAARAGCTPLAPELPSVPADRMSDAFGSARAWPALRARHHAGAAHLEPDLGRPPGRGGVDQLTTCRPGQGSHCALAPRAKGLPSMRHCTPRPRPRSARAGGGRDVGVERDDGAVGRRRRCAAPLRRADARARSRTAAARCRRGTTRCAPARRPARSARAAAPRRPAAPARGSASSRCRKSITSRQTGAAPVTPLTSCIGAPLALPTQTPTV